MDLPNWVVNENHTLFSGHINDHIMINDHISLKFQIQVGNHFQGALGGDIAEGRRSLISP